MSSTAAQLARPQADIEREHVTEDRLPTIDSEMILCRWRWHWSLGRHVTQRLRVVPTGQQSSHEVGVRVLVDAGRDVSLFLLALAAVSSLSASNRSSYANVNSCSHVRDEAVNDGCGLRGDFTFKNIRRRPRFRCRFREPRNRSLDLARKPHDFVTLNIGDFDFRNA